MNDWTLATRNGFFAIHGDSMEDEVITGRPLIIDPSITFRKHFEIPGSVNKSPENLKLELFARFLPSEIDNYVCQFLDGPVSSDGTRRVLGLALKEKDMQWLEGLHGEESQKYFLESLLASGSESSGAEALELPLPNGIYFGVLQDGFLRWARYLSDPRTKTLDQTRDYIREEFTDVADIQRLPDFPREEDEATDWIHSIKKWLPETPDQSKILSRERSRSYWEEWRSTAWTLLFLAYVTAGVWILYNYRSVRQQRNWLQSNGKKLFESTANPNRKLSSEIQSIRRKLKTQSQQVLDVYPRLFQLDRAIRNNDVYLLQLKIRKNQCQLVVMTNSLKAAEAMKQSLLNVPNISRVEIVSTQPQQDSDYQYKVNLNMMWSTEP